MIWLVYWIVGNDGAATIREQRGPFRMQPPAVPQADPAPEGAQTAEASQTRPHAPGPGAVTKR
jgi:hypothetical protein